MKSWFLRGYSTLEWCSLTSYYDSTMAGLDPSIIIIAPWWCWRNIPKLLQFENEEACTPAHTLVFSFTHPPPITTKETRTKVDEHSLPTFATSDGFARVLCWAPCSAEPRSWNQNFVPTGPTVVSNLPRFCEQYWDFAWFPGCRRWNWCGSYKRNHRAQRL